MAHLQLELSNQSVDEVGGVGLRALGPVLHGANQPAPLVVERAFLAPQQLIGQPPGLVGERLLPPPPDPCLLPVPLLLRPRLAIHRVGTRVFGGGRRLGCRLLCCCCLGCRLLRCVFGALPLRAERELVLLQLSLGRAELLLGAGERGGVLARERLEAPLRRVLRCLKPPRLHDRVHADGHWLPRRRARGSAREVALLATNNLAAL